MLPRICVSIHSLACLAALAVSSGCSSIGEVGTNPRLYAIGAEIPKGGGRYLIGKPITMNGRTYVPREQPHYDETGLASWYGAQFHGRLTANGEIFDKDRLTAGHATLPLPSYVEVTNLENGRSLILRANDRGPFIAGRIIDVSERAAHLLGFHSRGLVRARVRYIGRAPLDGNDNYEESVAAEAARLARRTGPTVRP